MKKSAGLYLSAREASAELAISQATLYAYVSRGLIRSEPSEDSRSHRYRAEDVRTLKERRTPAPEPRGMRSFDADLPVMDSAVATITEDGADLSRRQLRRSRRTRHARTHRDAAVGRHRRRSVRAGQLPRRVGRDARGRRGHARGQRDRSRHRRAGAGGQRRPARLHPRARRPRDGRRPHRAARGRDHAEREIIGKAAAPADRAGLGARQQARRRSDPPRAGAAGRSRIERLDLHRALRGLDRPQSL